jgi:hypothetical protein
MKLKSGFSIRFSIRSKELEMKKAKYVLIPVMVTLVVLVVSIFPPATLTRKASAAPRGAVVTKYLMIPVAAFTVIEDGEDYYNGGASVHFITGDGGFVAPVYLPHGARIRTIRLFAFDINKNHNLCARLFQVPPSSAVQLGYVCTTGSSGAQQPTLSLSHYVKWYFGYVFRLNFPASAGLSTYAVLIKYNVRQ